ncbi:MAG: hypothetical protein U0Q12_02345 [Vicinamibacterales bacterium]
MIYASEEEIAELAKVAGECGGHSAHMRNEGDRLAEAIDEALRIGSTAGTPVRIFHLKTAGRANWPRMDLALARIKPRVRRSGRSRRYAHPSTDWASARCSTRDMRAGQVILLERLTLPDVRAEMRRDMETSTGWENWYLHAGKDWDRIVIAGVREGPTPRTTVRASPPSPAP